MKQGRWCDLALPKYRRSFSEEMNLDFRPQTHLLNMKWNCILLHFALFKYKERCLLFGRNQKVSSLHSSQKCKAFFTWHSLDLVCTLLDLLKSDNIVLWWWNYIAALLCSFMLFQERCLWPLLLPPTSRLVTLAISYAFTTAVNSGCRSFYAWACGITWRRRGVLIGLVLKAGGGLFTKGFFVCFHEKKNNLQFCSFLIEDFVKCRRTEKTSQAKAFAPLAPSLPKANHNLYLILQFCHGLRGGVENDVIFVPMLLVISHVLFGGG